MTRRKAHDPELVRIAYHEAAHAVCALALGEVVDLVSIDAAGDYNGITCRTLEARPPPKPSTAPRFFAEPDRWYTEAKTIVIKLAGEVGGELALTSGYRAAIHDDEGMARMVAPLARGPHPLGALTEAHVARLEDAASGAGEGDEADAWFLANPRFGDGAIYLVGWLRQVARRIVWENVESVRRVAAALLVYHRLTGDDIVALVNADGEAVGTQGGTTGTGQVESPPTSRNTAPKASANRRPKRGSRP